MTNRHRRHPQAPTSSRAACTPAAPLPYSCRVNLACSQSMTEYTERLLTETPRKDTADRFRIVWLVVIPLVAILFQVYVPRFIPFLAYLELPLLITVHFALSAAGRSRRCFMGCPSAWCRTRCRISRSGCSASSRPWWATSRPRSACASTSQNPVVTFILSFFFYFFHQFFYWVLARALLGEALGFDVAANSYFWAIECGGGPAFVPHFG